MKWNNSIYLDRIPGAESCCVLCEVNERVELMRSVPRDQQLVITRS